MALAHFKGLCINVHDPERISRFWAAVLGRLAESLTNGAAMISVADAGDTIWINRVPEAKTTKNRVDLDIYAQTLEELEALGARTVDHQAGQGQWAVTADPEGNKFCAFLRAGLPPGRLKGLVIDSADLVAAAEWWADAYGAKVERHDDRWAT